MKKLKLLFVVLILMIATISNAQRYRSGNGSTIWNGHHLKVKPVMVDDVKFTDIEIMDLTEQDMLFCYVGNFKFYFADGTTMTVQNNAPLSGQNIFTTYITLTEEQHEILRNKKIDSWVLLLKNGSKINDRPPTPNYLKVFANKKIN